MTSAYIPGVGPAPLTAYGAAAAAAGGSPVYGTEISHDFFSSVFFLDSMCHFRCIVTLAACSRMQTN